MASVSRLKEVSVVIVSYNTRESLLRCLQSIDPACEVIVVDNASRDGSADAVRGLPGILLIENKQNLGFGTANNQGLALATRPLVLLLNSDAQATPGAIEELAAVFSDESIVVAGGMLLSPDGNLQESCANELTLWAVFCEQTFAERALKSSFLFSPYWMSHRLAKLEEPADVAQVMGACLMLRPLEKFDEHFFLYCEDTELCKRMRKHGRIVYVPWAKFHHELGTSSVGMRWRAVAMYNCGKELYFRIHRSGGTSAVCFVLDRFGALVRLVMWLLLTMASAGTNRRASALSATFWRVLWAPVSYRGLRPPR